MADYRDQELPATASPQEVINSIRALKIGRYSVEVLEIPQPGVSRPWRLRVWKSVPYPITEHRADD